MFAGYRNQIKRWRMMGLGMNSLGRSYIDKVLNTQSANLIGYWPLNEIAGAVADNIQGVSARDGAYTGVTLNSIIGPDGVNGAPLFDGVNDFVNIHSASLNTAFGPPLAGTIAVWARVINVGIWTDGLFHFTLIFRIDAANRVFVRKDDVNNRLRFFYQAGGVNKNISQAGIDTTDWFHMAVTWDVGADEMMAYFNGVAVGIGLNAIGTLVGNLDATRTVIGAQTTGPLLPWSGYTAHAAVWTIALTPTEILSLATV